MVLKNTVAKPTTATTSTPRNENIERTNLMSLLAQTEQALKSVKAELNCILDNADHSIRIINRDFSVRLVNKAFAKLSGASPEEATGQKCYDVFHSPYCHTPACCLTRILDGEEMVTCEVEKQGKDGTTVTYVSIATPFHGPDGNLIGIVETLRDITNHKQAQKQLWESENRYRALINLEAEVGEAIVMLQDLDGREGIQTFVSEQWPRITGYTKEELLGTSFFDLLRPEDRETSMKRHRRKMSGETLPGLFEVSIVRKDGSQTPAELTSAYTTYQGQRANVVFVRDITQRKQAEEELRCSEERFRSTLDNLLESCQIIGFDWRYLYVNPAGERVGRLTREEKLGRTVMEMHPGIERTELFSAMHECMQQRAPRHMETQFHFPDGGQGWFELYIQPVPEGIFILSLDITDRKTAETRFREHHNIVEEMVASRTTSLVTLNEQLRKEIGQRQYAEDKLRKIYGIEKELRLELESQMRQRVEFTRALIHELKTPLTPILAASEMLTRQLHGKPSQTFAISIRSAARQLNNRIDELFDLIRGEIGTLRLKLGTVYPKQLLVDIARDMTPEASNLGHTLVTDVSPRLKPIRADQDRLRQIIFNLLNNAFKFTPAGGSVILRARQQDDQLLVEVQDTGPGISENEQKNLFKAYHQPASNREHLGGLGLGLALARMLVELHGGNIWVTSQKGKGSTFSFSLPSKRPASKKQRKSD